jgi:hypothetical protein
MQTPNSIQTYSLSPAQAMLLKSTFTDFRYEQPTDLEPALGDSCRRFTSVAPPGLLLALDQLRRGRLAALVVEGLPFDPTVRAALKDPIVAVAPKSSRLSEGLLMAVTARCGYLYGVRTEGEGAIVNLCPTVAHKKSFTGLGSTQVLGLHIENGLLARLGGGLGPGGLVLIGLHGDPAGNPKTFVADARRALRRTGPKVERELRQIKGFYQRLPQRWRAPGRPDGRLAAPVAGSGDNISFAFALYGDMIEATSMRSRHALNAFADALEAEAVGIEVIPGRMLVINNRIAAHGRDSFPPTFGPDGTPFRWLQRAFWTNRPQAFATWNRSGPRVLLPPTSLLDD